MKYKYKSIIVREFLFNLNLIEIAEIKLFVRNYKQKKNFKLLYVKTKKKN